MESYSRREVTKYQMRHCDDDDEDVVVYYYLMSSNDNVVAFAFSARSSCLPFLFHPVWMVLAGVINLQYTDDNLLWSEE
jgi:hypothetical protein